MESSQSKNREPIKNESYGLLANELESAKDKLLSWVSLDRYDNTSYTVLKDRLYIESCHILDRIYRASDQAGVVMRLTLPETADPVPTYGLSKSPYDFINLKSRKPLEPGNSFDLPAQKILENYQDKRSNIYYGSWVRFIEVADIARSLSKSGQLVLAFNEPESS